MTPKVTIDSTECAIFEKTISDLFDEFPERAGDIRDAILFYADKAFKVSMTSGVWPDLRLRLAPNESLCMEIRRILGPDRAKRFAERLYDPWVIGRSETVGEARPRKPS